MSARVSTAARAIFAGLIALPRAAATALGAPDGAQPYRPRRLIAALLIVLPLALFVRWGEGKAVIVMSPSIEAWAVRPSPGPIRRGDYVMFELSHPLAGPKPVNITKNALCLPGDRLAMREQRSVMASDRTPMLKDVAFFCNGRFLGISKPYGRNGQALSHFLWFGSVVPPGVAYVGSANPDSFDSRYFGFVSLKRLTRMERFL